MEPDRSMAELALENGSAANPGPWAAHSRHVAEACERIASHCPGLSPERAYVLGLLHDIGRYAGVTSERHLIDGYRYCMEQGWEKAAQICVSHAFMIQDVETSIGNGVKMFLFRGPGAQDAVAVCLLVVEGEMLDVGIHALGLAGQYLFPGQQAGQETVLEIVLEVTARKGGTVNVQEGVYQPTMPAS